MGEENHKTISTLILLLVKIGVTYKLRSNDLIAKFTVFPEGKFRESLGRVGQCLHTFSSSELERHC